MARFCLASKKMESRIPSQRSRTQICGSYCRNVNWGGEMNKWVNFYGTVMGFEQLISFDDKDISTEYTALMSKVMANGNMRIKFPINEPAKGKKNHKLRNI